MWKTDTPNDALYSEAWADFNWVILKYERQNVESAGLKNERSAQVFFFKQARGELFAVNWNVKDNSSGQKKLALLTDFTKKMTLSRIQTFCPWRRHNRLIVANKSSIEKTFKTMDSENIEYALT
jgi:hypothetical protein